MTTSVRIRLLGRFEIEVDGTVIDDAAFDRRHAASLVKLLSLTTGRRLHREQVIDVMWPDSSVDEAAPRLYKAASYARKALGDKSAIALRDANVLLWPDVEPEIDVEQFEVAADLAYSGSTEAAAAAADLYSGDLLPGDPYEQWVVEARQRLRLRFLEVLRAAARWEAILDIEPADEAAHVALMRRFIDEGQRLSALRQFERLERALGEEFGVSPSAEAIALVAEFQPLRADLSSPNNLPSAVDAFVGRGGEVADVVAALKDSRLVTLTGVGGTGKTRLALEAAAELLGEFLDGVWLVELAPVSEAAAVPFVVGAAVGAVQQPGKSMLDSLLGSLASRDLLLVMDNCEHLLDEVAELVLAVEGRCASVKVLATSREGLGLRGEHLRAVGSLAPAEARELFATRAHDVGTEVAASDEVAGRIVERVDGLPLAIELAAARTRGLTVAEIEERLTERFRLLRGSSRGRVERHQTLWNTVAWSHRLLEPVERLVFDRLSVFAGGFTLDAATHVCATDGGDEFDVEDAVLALVERSMVAAETGLDGTRYRLLETLRQFGETQLLDNDTIDEFRGRHADWYTEFAKTAAEGVRGVDGIEWSRRLRGEFGNYRAVVYGTDIASARRIVASIGFAAGLSQFFEYLEWVLEIVNPPAADDLDWIGCAVWGMRTTDFIGRGDDRTDIAALVDIDAIPAGPLKFCWLNSYATDALASGQTPAPFLEAMLDTASVIDDNFWRLYCSGQVLLLSILAGDLDLAATIRGRLSSDPARNMLPTAEAVVSFQEGRYLTAIGDGAALGCFERSRRLSAECGWSMIEHLAGSERASLLIDAGDLPSAQHGIVEAINSQIQAGDHLTLAMTLHHLVRLLDAKGHDDQALEIWAELTDRGGWANPQLRADLETRLGPPGQPELDDDELVVLTKDVIGQLT